MKNIIKILRISKPLYKIIFGLAVLIIINTVIGLIIPIISKFAIDEITLKVSNHGGDLNRIYLFVAIGFGVALIGVIVSSLNDRLGDLFAGRLRKFLTEKFYDKVLTLPQSYFDSEISGKIINQLNRGIASIQDFMNTSTNFILPSLLQAILTVVVLAKYNVSIALFIFMLFPIYLVISYFSAKRWGKHEEKKNKIEDVTRGRLQEVVSNIKLVKSFTNEENEYSLISNNLLNINKIYSVQSNEFHLFDFLRTLSLNIILSVVSLILFYNTFNGLLTFGELVLIIQLVNQARQPLFAMSFILGQIQRAETGSKEYFEILNLESKENYNVQESKDKLKNPSLEFKKINFKYETSDVVLRDISFKISQNETVALVGPSGAGKSTIINLILKFYETSSGEILLNGKNYKDLTHKYIRNNISLVFQDNELFSSTIRENVSYGQEVLDDEVINALKLANAYSFVNKLPNGINSEIGERGVRLSGGQKQRIQIARAILKNAPILILDEATSNLDAKSESEVQDALDKLMKNKLVIIIAHRFSTIQNATKIIVINNQEVEDIGTPQDLSKKKGIYSELLNYQIEGNKKLLKKFEIY